MLIFPIEFPGTPKYANVSYTCGDSTLTNVIVCETYPPPVPDSSIASLTCANNASPIKVLSATYSGPANSPACQADSESCQTCSLSAKETVATLCDGRRTCSFGVDNTVLGLGIDPCFGVHKGVNVSYVCAAPLLGSYDVVKDMPTPATHMLHIPGTEKYMLASTYDARVPNDPWHYIAFLVDRNTQAAQPLNATSGPICGGYAYLPDGDILIAGGLGEGPPNGAVNQISGLDRTKIFTRETQKFQWDHSLTSPRYYATLVYLPNGMAVSLGGNDANDLDPFVMGVDFQTGYYPISFLLPDENVVTLFDTTGGIINPMTGQLLAKLPSLGTHIHFEAHYTATYAPLMMSYEDGYTVVELLIVGGSTGLSLTATANSLSYRISITVLGNNQYGIGAWQIEDTLHPRIMGDMTVLPNGHIVVSGGQQDGQSGYFRTRVPQLTSQIYRPAAPLGSRFTDGPVSGVSRAYHSSVALTTDGTLFIAGSDQCPQGFVGEILTPSYVVNTDLVRPIISSVVFQGQSVTYPGPAVLGMTLGGTFSVELANLSPSMLGTNHVWATLVSPSLTTHGRNTGQRVIKLAPMTQQSDATFSFQVPAVRGVIPAGWHMLFVMNGMVYSKGVWVTVSY
ncbi:MAG: hypothetical protein WDW36_008086 [Sanguina aurantia]